MLRSLKGLDERMVGLSVTHWLMAEHGWTFAPGEGVVADGVNGVEFLHQLYTRANPTYSGRVTVPVLWDKQRHTMSQLKSSACSTVPLMASARDREITIRSRCAPRSTG
jgi:glutathionyl-hydroquinone reductase